MRSTLYFQYSGGRGWPRLRTRVSGPGAVWLLAGNRQGHSERRRPDPSYDEDVFCRRDNVTAASCLNSNRRRTTVASVLTGLLAQFPGASQLKSSGRKIKWKIAPYPGTRLRTRSQIWFHRQVITMNPAIFYLRWPRYETINTTLEVTGRRLRR